MKYIVMVVNEETHTARKVIVTRDIATAQKETRIRIGQGIRAYWIIQESKED